MQKDQINNKQQFFLKHCFGPLKRTSLNLNSTIFNNIILFIRRKLTNKVVLKTNNFDNLLFNILTLFCNQQINPLANDFNWKKSLQPLKKKSKKTSADLKSKKKTNSSSDLSTKQENNEESLLDPTPFDLIRDQTEPIYEHIFYIAIVKSLQVGDKMSGRHGNKGIISQILPFYDMPYLIDGTPIDIVLNPLGVPSRMNVGQIFESLLGLSGFFRHEYYRIPPFDEHYGYQFSRNFVYSKLNELNKYSYNSFSKAKSKKQTTLLSRVKMGLNPSFPGKMRLIDGQTGDTFFRPVIVGKSYMLKLNHLVDHKIHSRTTGPYSLVTQQPLKGRRNLGGQRIGEMEVWSFYAFGSASLLLELLTIKSDDLKKRKEFFKTNLMETMQTEELLHETSLSESFRVLVLHLRALCLDLDVITQDIVSPDDIEIEPYFSSSLIFENQPFFNSRNNNDEIMSK